MRKIIVFAALLASLAVTACNTVEGAGKDVKAAGQGIQNAAEESK